MTIEASRLPSTAKLCAYHLVSLERGPGWMRGCASREAGRTPWGRSLGPAVACYPWSLSPGASSPCTGERMTILPCPPGAQSSGEAHLGSSSWHQSINPQSTGRACLSKLNRNEKNVSRKCAWQSHLAASQSEAPISARLFFLGNLP
jgi:hypothetical protein